MQQKDEVLTSKPGRRLRCCRCRSRAIAVLVCLVYKERKDMLF